MYLFGLARWRLLRTLEMHTTSISLLARARFTFTINDAALSNDHCLWSALHGRRGVVDPVRPGIGSVLLLNLLQLSSAKIVYEQDPRPAYLRSVSVCGCYHDDSCGENTKRTLLSEWSEEHDPRFEQIVFARNRFHCNNVQKSSLWKRWERQ